MSAIKVTQEVITSLIEHSRIEDIKLGEKTTVVHCTLPNGFVIVKSSSCVDPENYNHEIGKNICMKRIEDELWMLEGYQLQCQIAHEKAYEGISEAQS